MWYTARMNQPSQMKLLRTYRVKLAYGRDLYGHRCVVEIDGRQQDMTRSEFRALEEKARPRDQNRFYPALKVGQLVLARTAEQVEVMGLVTSVCKSSFKVNGFRCVDLMFTYPTLGYFKAALEASTPAFRALENAKNCVWAEYMNTRPDLGAVRPAHVQAAMDAYQAARVAIVAKHGLDYQQADELFGF